MIRSHARYARLDYAEAAERRRLWGRRKKRGKELYVSPGVGEDFFARTSVSLENQGGTNLQAGTNFGPLLGFIHGVDICTRFTPTILFSNTHSQVLLAPS